MGALLDPDKALELVLEHVPAAATVELPLAEALGRTLAEPLLASCDQPPFAKAMMDGFAVCVADAGAEVEVGGEVAAGSDIQTRVSPGVAVEIMTGAPCPPGTEAVVKVGRGLNLTVVVEGIETEAQLRWAREQQAHRSQGFYFSRPVPLRSLLKSLDSTMPVR